MRKTLEEKHEKNEKWSEKNITISFVCHLSIQLRFYSLTSHTKAYNGKANFPALLLYSPSPFNVVMCFVVTERRYYVYELMMLMGELSLFFSSTHSANISKTDIMRTNARLLLFSNLSNFNKIDYKGGDNSACTSIEFLFILFLCFLRRKTFSLLNFTQK